MTRGSAAEQALPVVERGLALSAGSAMPVFVGRIDSMVQEMFNELIANVFDKGTTTATVVRVDTHDNVNNQLQSTQGCTMRGASRGYVPTTSDSRNLCSN